MGALLEGLYFLVPTQTVSILEKWFGVSDVTIVTWLMAGIATTGAIMIALVIAITVWQHYGFQIVRKKAVKTTEPPSPRYVESGTPIIPKNGEPIILTSKLLAGIDFFPSREDLPPLNTLLGSAKHSVDVLALSAEAIIFPYRPILTQLLREGKHLRFILSNPSSDELTSKLSDFASPVTNKKQREVALEALGVMKTQLSGVERGRLDIRTYDLLPIHNIVIIDSQSENAVLNVEFFVYGDKPRSWLSLRIHKNQQPALFKKYLDSYEFAHERSKEWGG